MFHKVIILEDNSRHSHVAHLSLVALHDTKEYHGTVERAPYDPHSLWLLVLRFSMLFLGIANSDWKPLEDCAAEVYLM